MRQARIVEVGLTEEVERRWGRVAARRGDVLTGGRDGGGSG
jgi:hypothetical protein